MQLQMTVIAYFFLLRIVPLYRRLNFFQASEIKFCTR